MNEYKLIKSIINADKISELLDTCYAEYNESELVEGGYPGITLKIDDVVRYLSQFIEDDIKYDFSFGTGANFLVFQPYAGLGVHTDKPLYELDENYKLLPEYENRYCAVTVIGCTETSKDSHIAVVIEEDKEELVPMEVGDVLLIRGGVPHYLPPATFSKSSYVCGFYCDNINT